MSDVAIPDPSSPLEISIFDLIQSARRHARTLLLSGIIAGGLTVVVCLFLPRTYLADASFVTQGSQGGAGLSALAAQLGVQVPSSDASESPAFYVDLLTSRAVLDSVVATRYTVEGRAPEPLTQILEFKGPPVEQRERAIKAVRSAMTVDQSRSSNVVTIQVRTKFRGLSLQLVSRLLQSLNDFNLHSRQSRASAERRFVEARAAEAKAQLDSSDAALRSFLQENRAYAGSPQLTLEHDRLVRDAGFRQELYANLASALDKARMDELRDTPVITVLNAPAAHAGPEPRGLWKKLILGFIVGVTLAVIVLFGRSTWAAAGPWQLTD